MTPTRRQPRRTPARRIYLKLDDICSHGGSQRACFHRVGVRVVSKNCPNIGSALSMIHVFPVKSRFS
jgi:hypothetical protein